MIEYFMTLLIHSSYTVLNCVNLYLADFAHIEASDSLKLDTLVDSFPTRMDVKDVIEQLNLIITLIILLKLIIKTCLLQITVCNAM